MAGKEQPSLLTFFTRARERFRSHRSSGEEEDGVGPAGAGGGSSHPRPGLGFASPPMKNQAARPSPQLEGQGPAVKGRSGQESGERVKVCQKLTKFAPEFDIFSRFARLPSAKGLN